MLLGGLLGPLLLGRTTALPLFPCADTVPSVRERSGPATVHRSPHQAGLAVYFSCHERTAQWRRLSGDDSVTTTRQHRGETCKNSGISGHSRKSRHSFSLTDPNHDSATTSASSGTVLQLVRRGDRAEVGGLARGEQSRRAAAPGEQGALRAGRSPEDG
eukprot:scaffold45581_cov73-Phaeocystis_antarctica.AAC.1